MNIGLLTEAHIFQKTDTRDCVKFKNQILGKKSAWFTKSCKSFKGLHFCHKPVTGQIALKLGSHDDCRVIIDDCRVLIRLATDQVEPQVNVNYDRTQSSYNFSEKRATPGLFQFIFVLFKHKFYRKNCRLQRDSNSYHRSRRQAR